MPSSGYIADVFIAGEIPTTSKWNELWGNDASFNNGNGFNDGIIVSRHLAAGISVPNVMSNPYKFRVYRVAALTSSTAYTVVPFDTKTFDTSTNIDVITNKGRFTAPIAGFYYFSAKVDLTSGGSFLGAVKLYKNGSQDTLGDVLQPTSSTEFSVGVNNTIQLATNDYVEIFLLTTIATTVNVGSTSCWFSGFLMSAT